MKVVLATRIYAPEVSAASGLLESWAVGFRDAGARVTVLTSTPPRGMVPDDPPHLTVRRARVIRDRQDYVRGYISYLSFDVPLAWRLLRQGKVDLYVVEPPPTTVAVVRCVAALFRTPYVVDAADLWSDAAALATRNPLVPLALRWLERWGLRGARHLFAAHQPLIDRFREVGIETPASPIGFGADTAAFSFRGDVSREPHFIYAGTHSEWHGAGIFVDAFAAIADRHPTARLTFIGNGQERDLLASRARELGLAARVAFESPVAPRELAPRLASATASLASLKPGGGYDYAFTTKVYSSLASGCPVIFTGTGPTARFIADAGHADVGVAVAYDADAVAAAMERAIANPVGPERREALSAWARATYSLEAVASTVVTASLALVSRP